MILERKCLLLKDEYFMLLLMSVAVYLKVRAFNECTQDIRLSTLPCCGYAHKYMLPDRKATWWILRAMDYQRKSRYKLCHHLPHFQAPLVPEGTAQLVPATFVTYTIEHINTILFWFIHCTDDDVVAVVAVVLIMVTSPHFFILPYTHL